MSIHINAENNQIAETVLLPGDPLRAKWIAETFLYNTKRYNATRNMLGFTGLTPEGKRISVQGSGMGMPSLAIYVNELIDNYRVKRIIRVGSCGGIQKQLKIKDIVLALGSCSDSAMNARRFAGMNFAPLADWNLLHTAYHAAKELAIPVHIGNIFATDKFYDDSSRKAWKIFAQYGVLAIEMETAELYTLACKKNIQALSILTVSDNLVTNKQIDAEAREKTFSDMIKIALRI